jgi:hypothetical protein
VLLVAERIVLLSSDTCESDCFTPFLLPQLCDWLTRHQIIMERERHEADHEVASLCSQVVGMLCFGYAGGNVVLVNC